jgi:hypothetical protein
LTARKSERCGMADYPQVAHPIKPFSQRGHQSEGRPECYIPLTLQY